MRAVVTGAAGFVGSHLVERLVEDGWDVVALDSITPYYDTRKKLSNVAALESQGVDVARVDLAEDDLDDYLAGADVLFHQAGQPGVRASWDSFGSYVESNVIATERLLRAVGQAGVQRVVYVSSSSIYGDAATYPTPETTLPRPKSPYGVTKLAGEHLVGVFSRNYGIPSVSLRYFTVFGPRQRPDMAMYRLIDCAFTGSSFPLFGTGEQIRDFTYVADVVNANVLAATASVEGSAVVNVAGGDSVTLNEVISIVEELVGSKISRGFQGSQRGDVERTGGSIDRAASILGWSPVVPVSEGLERQVDWQRRLLDE